MKTNFIFILLYGNHYKAFAQQVRKWGIGERTSTILGRILEDFLFSAKDHLGW